MAEYILCENQSLLRPSFGGRRGFIPWVFLVPRGPLPPPACSHRGLRWSTQHNAQLRLVFTAIVLVRPNYPFTVGCSLPRTWLEHLNHAEGKVNGNSCQHSESRYMHPDPYTTNRFYYYRGILARETHPREPVEPRGTNQNQRKNRGGSPRRLVEFCHRGPSSYDILQCRSTLGFRLTPLQA